MNDGGKMIALASRKWHRSFCSRSRAADSGKELCERTKVPTSTRKRILHRVSIPAYAVAGCARNFLNFLRLCTFGLFNFLFFTFFGGYINQYSKSILRNCQFSESRDTHRVTCLRANLLDCIPLNIFTAHYPNYFPRSKYFFLLFPKFFCIFSYIRL